MKQIARDLRRALEAMACADAGEYLSRRQKARMIGPRVEAGEAPPVAMESSIGAGRRVALATGGGSRRAFDYAIQCCRQLRADLDVLLIGAFGPELPPAWREALHACGVQWRRVRLRGNLPGALAGYLRAHAQPLFLVADDGGFPTPLPEVVEKALWPSNVPLVVVADTP